MKCRWVVLIAGVLFISGCSGESEMVKPSAAVHISVLSVGSQHACAAEGRRVWCWGDGADGQLGYPGRDDTGDDERPVDVGPVPLDLEADVVQLSAGGIQSCALTEMSELWCWGGRGHTAVSDDGYSRRVPHNEDVGARRIRLGAGELAVEVSAGVDHTCARSDAGRVWCWGSNEFGQVADDGGRLGEIVDPAAVRLPSGIKAEAVSAGMLRTCAVVSGGRLWCWGMGTELGRDSDAEWRVPAEVDVPSGVQVADVEVSLTSVVPCHTWVSGRCSPVMGITCVLTVGATVRCWSPGVTQLENAVFRPGVLSDSLDFDGAKIAKLTRVGQRRCFRDGGWCWRVSERCGGSRHSCFIGKARGFRRS